MHQRRQERDPVSRRMLSKKIHKQARQELRCWRTLWSEHLLTKFRNTKFIQKVNIDPVKQQACPIESDLFADFLGDLFKSPNLPEVVDRSTLQNIDPFSLEELNRSLQHLSNLRAADEDGLVAEMLKHGSDLMKDELLKSYNFILRTGEIEVS